MPLPPLNDAGDLPPGIHPATIGEVVERFGLRGPQRRLVALRLERIHRLAVATGHLHRCLVFGSFVTAKETPNDVDVFLLMTNSFDLAEVFGEARILWDHAGAQVHFGASVFWMRRQAAFPNEAEAVSHWQIRRDGGRRGIVEVIPELP